jgi:hypothetical protein
MLRHLPGCSLPLRLRFGFSCVSAVASGAFVFVPSQPQTAQNQAIARKSASLDFAFIQSLLFIKLLLYFELPPERIISAYTFRRLG